MKLSLIFRRIGLLNPLSFALFSFLFFSSGFQTVFAQGKFPPSPVKVETVSEQIILKPLTLIGTVEPRNQSVVASEVEGLVETFPLEEGMRIRKGDLLAGLSKDTLKIQLRAAEAQREEAKARYKQAKSNLERSQHLFGEKVLSAKTLENDEAEAEAWVQKIKQNQAEMDRLQDLINKSQILAPYAGDIVKTQTEVGEWLQKGGAVAEIIDLSHVRINVALPEKYIGSITVGNEVEVTLDALPDRTFTGKVFSIIPQADPESRSFPVKIDLKNKKRELKSGLLARVSLPIGPSIRAITVPKDALVIRGGKYMVYVVNQEEKGWTVSPVDVKTGLMVNNWVEIQGSLKLGQKVVTRGNERLRPGQEVTLTE